ncbi:uncharacterized protein LOC123321918 [Coccinella septempunctata]|uniref:uncharacterized protein LOC123321918 n=1 Tax=Coccinella septempunctata TaxID=41139 RepID=UPI001D082EFC|nr:uncharacterized protein LOC123321918 [Coccinella septempunctata]
MTLNNVQVDQARSGDQENNYFMQDVPGVDLINTDNLDTENLANNIRGHARVQSGSRIQGVSERNINVKSNLSSNFNLPQCLPGLNVQTAHYSGQQQISNLTMNDNLFGLGDLSKLVPDFDGESHVQAPEFLQFLENGINVNAISFNNIRILLCKSFKGSAKLWWEAYSNYFSNYSQFKTEFLSHFWDRKRQYKIKEKLENSEYVSGLFTDHFNYWIGAAKHLQPPYTVIELIDLIAPHFPPNVASSLLGCTTFSDAVSRLRQADHYFKNKPSNSQNFQKKINFANTENTTKNPNSHRYGFTTSNRQGERVFSNKTISVLEAETQEQGNGEIPH